MQKYNKLLAALIVPFVAILFALADFAGTEIPLTQDEVVTTLGNILALLMSAVFVWMAPKNAGGDDEA